MNAPFRGKLGATIERVLRSALGRLPAGIVVIAALAGSWALQRRADPPLPAGREAAQHAVAPARNSRVSSVRAAGDLVRAGAVVAIVRDEEDQELALRAPVDGTIAHVSRGPGDLVGAGEALLTIAATGRVLVHFQ